MAINLEAEKQWFMAHLGVGAQNATTVRELSRTYGVSTRSMNEMIKRARDNHLPIASLKDDKSGQYGIFMPRFDYEALDSVAMSYREISSHLRTTDTRLDTSLEWIESGKILRSLPAKVLIFHPAIILRQSL